MAGEVTSDKLQRQSSLYGSGRVWFRGAGGWKGDGQSLDIKGDVKILQGCYVLVITMRISTKADIL